MLHTLKEKLSSPLANVLILSVSFCLIFLAFNGLQVLMTSVVGDLGFTSLILAYLVMGFSSPAVPLIIEKIGHKRTLLIGVFTYVIFIGANLYPEDYILLPASIVNGLGAAFTWSAQGAFLVLCSDATNLGFYTGLFFSIFMVHQVLGNLLSGIMLNSGLSTMVLFGVFAVIAIVGSCLLFLLQPPSAHSENKSGMSLSTMLLSPLKMFTDPTFLLMMPLMVYNGFSGEFIFGSMPREISYYSQDTIGFAYAVFGAVNTLVSIVGGRLSDKVGRLPMMVAMAITQLAAQICANIASPAMPALYYVTTSLMGLSDALLNTQMYASIGFLFSDRLEQGFSAFKLLQCTSCAVAFLLAKYIPFVYISILTTSLLIIGTTCYIVLSRRVTLDVSGVPEAVAKDMVAGTDAKDSTPPPIAVTQYGQLEEDWTDDQPTHQPASSTDVHVRRMSYEHQDWTE